MINQRERIALLSNYSWAYLSSSLAKKHFPGADLTLFTVNTKGVSEKHDFGMAVVEIADLSLKDIFFPSRRLFPYRGERFDGVVLDYGFSLSTLMLLAALKHEKIFVIETDGKSALRPLGRLGFMRMLMDKMPYFVNRALIKLSMRLKMPVSLGSPSELYIETTTACNLKCAGCPTGLGQLNRPPMMISPGLFGDIVERNRKNFRYLDVIYPFLYGEPLLNKEIFGYLRVLRKLAPPYARIELHTNGNIGDSKRVAGQLLETGIDFVNIAMDGTDRESYESFRRGGDFELLREFVRDLTAAKKERGLSRPEIVVQMILTKYSQDKMERLKALKDELGADRYVFKEFFYEFTGLSEEEAMKLSPSKRELVLTRQEKDRIIEKKKNLCGWPYRAISILCNGDVTPCCIDSNASILKGLSICGSTIEKVWNSSRYVKFRREMLSGRVSLCNKCFLS